MQVVAKRLEPKQSAAAGDTSNKAAYFFELPTIIDGEVVITLSGIDVPRLVIEADSSQNTRREKAVAAQDMYPTFDSISTLYQSYFRNIGAYEPTYFLLWR